MTSSSAAETHPVGERIRRPGPKQILALDGGGLRGMITLAFLKRIETVLAESSGAGSAFRLRDHFDMVGGTSIGALLATGLSLGYTVDDAHDALLDLGRKLFRGPRLGMFGTRMMGRRLDDILQGLVGEITLGSRDMTCALVVIAKRLDSNSVWALHNNPFGRYYNASTDDAAANKDFLMRRILRASAAPPTYVTPELMEIAKGHSGFFIDGAISPFNNPALLMFLMATTPSYGYAWTADERMLNLVSVGTGLRRGMRPLSRLQRMPSVFMGAVGLFSILEDCARLGHMTLQSLSAARVPWLIDSEAGMLDHEKAPQQRLLSYTRFELPLDRVWIEDTLGRQVDERQLDLFARVDNVEGMKILYELASEAAERIVKLEYLVPAAA
jgi:hypothetical protein